LLGNQLPGGDGQHNLPTKDNRVRSSEAARQIA